MAVSSFVRTITSARSRLTSPGKYARSVARSGIHQHDLPDRGKERPIIVAPIPDDDVGPFFRLVHNLSIVHAGVDRTSCRQMRLIPPVPQSVQPAASRSASDSNRCTACCEITIGHRVPHDGNPQPPPVGGSPGTRRATGLCRRRSWLHRSRRPASSPTTWWNGPQQREIRPAAKTREACCINHAGDITEAKTTNSICCDLISRSVPVRHKSECRWDTRGRPAAGYRPEMFRDLRRGKAITR